MRPLHSLAALALAAASPAVALPPGDYERAVTYRGVERVYLLHVPDGHDETTPIPLVLDLHGAGSNKDEQRGISGLLVRSDVDGFAVAWPDGTDETWNAGFCCGGAVENQVDDVGFLRTLADAIAREVAIDRRRVTVSGLSNGGAMSHRLACEASDVFAAAAPLAFPIGLIPIESCTPARPMPVLTFQGLHDELVPYEGSVLFPSAEASFAYWRGQGGCGDGEVEETTVSGGSDCRIDTSCAAGVEVGLCSINSTETISGGHILFFNPDWVLGELVADFLLGFSLPGDAPALPAAVGGKRLVMKDGPDAAKRRLTLALKDPAMALDAAADPTASGAALAVWGSGATEDVACFALPAAHWKRKGAGFVYKDKDGLAGPCASAKLAAGRLEVSCSGKAAPLDYSLDEPAQGAVSARFALPGQAFCATFGGTVSKDTSTAGGKAQFAAKSAPPPAACPAAPVCPQ